MTNNQDSFQWLNFFCKLLELKLVNMVLYMVQYGDFYFHTKYPALFTDILVTLISRLIFILSTMNVFLQLCKNLLS